jgi:hypothetical protein
VEREAAYEQASWSTCSRCLKSKRGVP